MILLSSNGHEIVLDDADHSLYSKWSWVAVQKNGIWYVCRNTYAGGGRAAKRTKRVYLHRLILDNPKSQVDHLNGNGLDNRRCNLRAVSHSENQRNRIGAQANSKSGVRGVYWNKRCQKWAASIRANGTQINLGLHADIESAKAARQGAELSMWAAADRTRAAPTERKEGKS